MSTYSNMQVSLKSLPVSVYIGQQATHDSREEIPMATSDKSPVDRAAF